MKMFENSFFYKILTKIKKFNSKIVYYYSNCLGEDGKENFILLSYKAKIMRVLWVLMIRFENFYQRISKIRWKKYKF